MLLKSTKVATANSEKNHQSSSTKARTDRYWDVKILMTHASFFVSCASISKNMETLNKYFVVEW